MVCKLDTIPLLRCWGREEGCMGPEVPGYQENASMVRRTFFLSLLCICGSMWEPLRWTRNEYKCIHTHTHMRGCEDFFLPE